jgi:hypothetical protein
MMKRTLWFALGAVAGATGSAYAKRKAREAAARYTPANLARGAVDRVTDAVREGRAAMAAKEAELRASPPPSVASPAVVVVEATSVEVLPSHSQTRYGPRRRARH